MQRPGTLLLITRPKERSQDLGEKLQALGYRTEFFPGIEIAPTQQLQKLLELQTAIENLKSIDIAIFGSRFAVQYGMKAIIEHYGQVHHGPVNDKRLDNSNDNNFNNSFYNNACNNAENKKALRFAAIGPGTAEELRHFGVQKIIYPKDPPFETESILALPEFQNVRGLQIMLFRGNGGRTLLRESLEERGAVVRTIECYERILPSISRDEVDLRCREWLENPFDRVIVTSLEVLNNLYVLLGQEHWQWFREIPMIVIGKRMLERARALGVQRMVLSEGAGDEFLMRALDGVKP